MAYPSTVATLTDPTANDRLNSPSHSAIETAQNTNIEEIQTFLGTEASAVGTIIYDVRSPSSNGGGHIQTVAKGGTGQTSYTKGDLLVAQNSSTLTRLAIGNDGEIFSANSSTASGVQWITNNQPKIFANASVFTLVGSVGGVASSSFLSTTVAGSTLGTNNVIESKVFIQPMQTASPASVIFSAHYGGQRVASILAVHVANAQGDWFGNLTHTMFANEAVNSQRHQLELLLSRKIPNAITQDVISYSGDAIINPTSTATMFAQVSGSSSINSSAPQTLGIEVSASGANALITRGGAFVQKIN